PGSRSTTTRPSPVSMTSWRPWPRPDTPRAPPPSEARPSNRRTHHSYRNRERPEEGTTRMNRLRHWWNSKWAGPVVSGAMIIASFVASGVFDASRAGDIAMLATAVVAGTPIVIKAIRALMTKVIGIDLLVSVAAIGA